MKLINAPGTEYLLDASLKSLHTESREWLSEIENHERVLRTVLNNTVVVDERGYRARHRSLVIEIHNTQVLIRKFKKQVFSFIK